MEMEDDVVKHLEMIQGVISRMANTSFIIKGWTLTLTTALLITSPAELKFVIHIIAILMIILFWNLDAFYLRQERLFRRLYDKVRIDPSTVEPFSMSTKDVMKDEKNILGVMFSRTEWPLYLTLILMTATVCVVQFFCLLG